MDSKLDLSKYLEDLEYLVNIDSGSKDIEGLNKVADFFTDRFKELGWVVDRHDFHDSVGPCLEIKNKKSDSFDVLLLGHTDTVFKKGTAFDRPFRLEDDKAFGPGVMDMKAGLLSIYYALKIIDQDQLPSVCIAFNSHEEVTSTYAYPWLQDLAKRSKVAFVTEPARANGALVNKRKGIAKYSLEFLGVAAHAGVEPEKGRSAIHEMGQWIVALNEIMDSKAETTLNIGVVEGGTAANVIAERAKAIVDIRFRDEKELVRIEQAMNAMAENPFIEGNQVIVERLGWRPPMNPTKETLKLCKVTESIAAEYNENIIWTSTGGGSDANFVAALGVPTLDGLGPIGGLAHSENEYLDVTSVETRVNILKELILKGYRVVEKGRINEN